MQCMHLVLLLVPSVHAVPRLVISQDFPDPSVILVDRTWYAFATQHNDTSLVQMARSSDWNNWQTDPGDALGCLPAWVDHSHPQMWAPDVMQLVDGSFVLYFSALAAGLGHHCLGVATSAHVQGPYISIDRPLACPNPTGNGANTDPLPYVTDGGRGGAIDGSGFMDDDGSLYVVFKIDGNSLGPPGDPCNNGGAESGKVPTPIILLPVQADGYTPRENAYQILDRMGEDGPLVEAPSLYRGDDGSYNLVYSSGCYLSPDYNIKVASSRSIRGPYVRMKSLAISNDGLGALAPGGADVAADGVHIAFHANIGGPDRRGMYIAEVNGDGKAIALI